MKFIWLGGPGQGAPAALKGKGGSFGFSRDFGLADLPGGRGAGITSFRFGVKGVMFGAPQKECAQGWAGQGGLCTLGRVLELAFLY